MDRSLLYPDCDFSIWFRSVNENNTTEIPLEGRQTGIIPEWITGALYQNGPGLLDVTGQRVQHLFDAFSLIQKFTIRSGHVTYQNRILQSDAYRMAHQTGKAHYAEYGTGRSEQKSFDQPKTESTSSWLLSRIRSLVSSHNDYRTDNAMISIYPYAVSRNEVALFAMTETPVMNEIDSNTIETRSKFKVSDHLPVVTHCAHPVLLNNGSLINVGLGSSLTGMNYVVFEFPGFAEINPTKENLMKKCRVLTKIPARWPFSPSYMHNFGVTEHYIILIEQPLCVSLVQMVQVTIAQGPMTDALAWHGNETVRFRVIDRDTMQEYTEHIYLTSAFFFLHAINAYEDGTHLIIDICCYENADMLKCMTIQALEEAQQNPDYLKQFRGRPRRFVLPLEVKAEEKNNLVHLNYTTCQVTRLENNKFWIEPETIVDVGCELPQVDHFRVYGKFYRYFYAINSDIDYPSCGAIRKIDILSKTCQIWHEQDTYVSEAIFVRNPSSNEVDGDEDDGVLIMSLLRSYREHEVSLLILNARDMTEIGRVQFETRGPIPKCLHGLWMDTSMN